MEKRDFNYFWQFDNPVTVRRAGRRPRPLSPNTAERTWAQGRRWCLKRRLWARRAEKPYCLYPLAYHGKKDGSLPVQKMETLSSTLKKAGAIVTTRIVEDKAHEYLDEETNRVYFDWLGKVVQ